jgi:hypothetical protein
MLGLDEYIINLLAGLVHLRIFVFEFSGDCLIKDVHQFIMKVSDRVPHLEYFHLEYFSMPGFDPYYKRVDGELVICDEIEHPRFGF